MHTDRSRALPLLLLLALAAYAIGCTTIEHAITPIQTVVSSCAAAPTFTPPAGTYSTAQIVTIACTTTPGATIYYTTNGTIPTTSSTVYTGPITVSASETINAIAVAAGYSNSPVATAAYVIGIPVAATPVFTPPAGTYTGTQTVTISDTTPGATIYYTTNGTTPTTSSTLYTGPITVSVSETIEAIAVAIAYTNSAVATAAYVIQPPTYSCATPGPGIICTVAGDGTGGYSGDGGPATSAELYNPEGAAVDSSGNLYIGDRNGNNVRKVTPAGVISTAAGNGTPGYSGDGGAATSAQLREPSGVAVDSSGNLYIADESNSRIRKVTTAGVISTVAGNGTVGYSGDGGAATSAQLWAPRGVAVDSSGDLYIADAGNNDIRKVTPAGIISTVAGVLSAGGYSGDGGAATGAQLNLPGGVAVDGSGNFYIADTLNQRVRKVTSAGIISTVAGDGTSGYGGDGGSAMSAELSWPNGVALDAAGNLYIADTQNSRVRRVTAAGTISTVAGDGTQGFSGDGGAAVSAELYSETEVTVDGSGDLYIADTLNSRVREVFNSTAAAPTFTPPAGIYPTAQSVTIASTTPGATIYYTTDGSIPTTASTLYTGPITVSTSETINAIAVATGYTNSPVATAAYSIQTVIASVPNLTVLGTSIIMDPDNVFSPSMLSQYGGTPATLALRFTAQSGLFMTFTATGKIACCTTIDIGPDGQSGSFTMPSVGSISGFTNPTGWPLVGVFTNGNPSGSAPAAFNYTSAGDSQLSYSPLLDQIFFIGDGLTGTGTGSVQTFYVPAGATELWLGIADVSGSGTPGSYGDNPGSFIVSATLR
jgi:sugar lactone lactonase YvrE